MVGPDYLKYNENFSFGIIVTTFFFKLGNIYYSWLRGMFWSFTWQDCDWVLFVSITLSGIFHATCRSVSLSSGIHLIISSGYFPSSHPESHPRDGTAPHSRCSETIRSFPPFTLSVCSQSSSACSTASWLWMDHMQMWPSKTFLELFEVCWSMSTPHVNFRVRLWILVATRTGK